MKTIMLARQPKPSLGVTLAFLLAAFFLRVYLSAFPGFIGDLPHLLRYADYAERFGVTGVANISEQHELYPPLFVYQACTIGKFGSKAIYKQYRDRPDVIEIIERVRFRLLPVAYDLFIGIAIFLCLASVLEGAWPLVAAATYLLTPGVVVNAAMWQFDPMPAFFLLTAFLLLEKACRTERAVLFGWSWMLFALAVGAKLQAAMMLPIIACATLMKGNLRTLIISGLAFCTTLLVLYAPFLIAGRFDYLNRVFAASFTAFPVTHANAYNLWGLWFQLPSTLKVFGVSLDRVGQFLYLGSAAWLLLNFVRLARFSTQNASLRVLSTASAYGALAPFMLMTRMHERYVSAAIAFLVISGFLDTRLRGVMLGFLLTYSLNLLDVLRISTSENSDAVQFVTHNIIRLFCGMLNVGIFAWMTAKLPELFRSPTEPQANLAISPKRL